VPTLQSFLPAITHFIFLFSSFSRLSIPVSLQCTGIHWYSGLCSVCATQASCSNAQHGSAADPPPSGLRPKSQKLHTSCVSPFNKLPGAAPREVQEALSRFQSPFPGAEIASPHPLGRVVPLVACQNGTGRAQSLLSCRNSGPFAASTLTIFLFFAFLSAFYRYFQGQVPGGIDSGRKSKKLASREMIAWPFIARSLSLLPHLLKMFSPLLALIGDPHERLEAAPAVFDAGDETTL